MTARDRVWPVAELECVAYRMSFWPFSVVSHFKGQPAVASVIVVGTILGTSKWFTLGFVVHSQPLPTHSGHQQQMFGLRDRWIALAQSLYDGKGLPSGSLDYQSFFQSAMNLASFLSGYVAKVGNNGEEIERSWYWG